MNTKNKLSAYSTAEQNDNIGALMPHKMRRVQKLHFIGIGGAGMGGIAKVCLNLGYQLSGSEIRRSSMTSRLTKRVSDIFIAHSAANLKQDNPVCQ